MSCSGLCPIDLEDESLMRQSAYRMQSALCLPETGVTSTMHRSLDNATSVSVICNQVSLAQTSDCIPYSRHSGYSSGEPLTQMAGLLS